MRRPRSCRAGHALIASLGLALTAGPVGAGGLAVFPVKLLDTSHEARDQSADHARRQAMMEQILAEGIDGAVTIGPAAVADACRPETTECLMALARDAGAERALLIVIQKTSTLIIQAFVTVVETETAQMVSSRSLNFRGDNDESWRRAAHFMAADLSP